MYRLETERQGHYFESESPRRSDSIALLDRSQAPWPLDHDAGRTTGEKAPETYPLGV
jgi:hypothetical protein